MKKCSTDGTDSIETLINGYLFKNHFNMENPDVYKFKECIEFWEDTDVVQIQEIIAQNPYNLYIDLAIYYEKGVIKLAQIMWDAYNPKQTKVDINQLNHLLLNGIALVQKYKQSGSKCKTLLLKKE